MTADTLKATISNLISAYNSWQIDSVVSDTWRSPSCIHQMLPASLELGPMNNDQYREYFGRVIPSLQGFHITVYDMIIDEKERKAVVHVDSTAESAVGPYKNELILFLRFDEEGKVVRIEQFVDSQYSVAFFAKLGVHVAAKSSGA